MSPTRLMVFPDNRVGAGDQDPGYCDYRGAPCLARCHHNWHYLRPAPAEETGGLLHQSTTHQRLWENLTVLFRQGETQPGTEAHMLKGLGESCHITRCSCYTSKMAILMTCKKLNSEVYLFHKQFGCAAIPTMDLFQEHFRTYFFDKYVTQT